MGISCCLHFTRDYLCVEIRSLVDYLTTKLPVSRAAPAVSVLATTSGNPSEDSTGINGKEISL